MPVLVSRLSSRQRSNLRFLRTKWAAGQDWARAYASRPFERLRARDRDLHVGAELPAPKRSYRPAETTLPTHLVTPPNIHALHTFFDISPVSSNGRYLVATVVPFLHRIPLPGDRAHVMVVDLLEQRSHIVYETRGWGAQLGAHTQ